MGIVLNAINIHQGGGKTLLSGLLDQLTDQKAIAYVDARLQYQPNGDHLKVVRVVPSLFGRVAAEWSINSVLHPDDTLICFGNLPPLIAKHPRTVLFLQNRYLFGKRDLTSFPVKPKLRIHFERLWLKYRLPFVTTVIVQTKTMADEFLHATGRHCIVCPFIPEFKLPVTYSDIKREKAIYDFLYVASGEPHKNHENLIAAWEVLAADSIKPSLALTIDESKDRGLWNRLSAVIQERGLNVYNNSDQSNVRDLYQRSRALIYPSMLESLGLPLLEASEFKLPILASELDFVRDSLDPEQTFDPTSPVSIARAVRRFLGVGETRPVVVTPGQFLESVLAQNN